MVARCSRGPPRTIGVESPSSTVAIAAYDSGFPFLIDDKDCKVLGGCQIVPNIQCNIVSSSYWLLAVV